MERRNVTLSLPKTLLKKAKILAVMKDRSLSDLLRETLEEKVKEFFKAAGFSEIYYYSLVSETDLKDCEVNPDKTLRVDNPVSREFEYLRPSLKINLRKAMKY